ncbi:Uncharacterised protein [Clostridium perfringens]|nr:hypothetical protein [Clostridium perfringens]SUY72707.1 Uncharacterised protein [Clostridium perfringens]
MDRNRDRFIQKILNVYWYVCFMYYLNKNMHTLQNSIITIFIIYILFIYVYYVYLKYKLNKYSKNTRKN